MALERTLMRGRYTLTLSRERQVLSRRAVVETQGPSRRAVVET